MRRQINDVNTKQSIVAMEFSINLTQNNEYIDFHCVFFCSSFPALCKKMVAYLLQSIC